MSCNLVNLLIYTFATLTVAKNEISGACGGRALDKAAT